jgi:thiamine monophosphate synthase
VGVAVISAIFGQENIREATERLKEKTKEMISL